MSVDTKHDTVTVRRAVRLTPQSSAPASDAGGGALYTKVVSGVLELYYRDDQGREIKLTNNGVPA